VVVVSAASPDVATGEEEVEVVEESSGPEVEEVEVEVVEVEVEVVVTVWRDSLRGTAQLNQVLPLLSGSTVQTPMSPKLSQVLFLL